MSKSKSNHTSGLLDELQEENAPGCKFSSMWGTMPEKLQRETILALQGTEFSTAQLVRALERRGYRIGRHRLQECRSHCTCNLLSGDDDGSEA